MSKTLAPRIVLASGNPGKAREIAQLLSDHQVEVLNQSAFNVVEVEETGLTFVENAILKARNAAAHSGLPAIADDSGLEVDALAGADSHQVLEGDGALRIVLAGKRRTKEGHHGVAYEFLDKTFVSGNHLGDFTKNPAHDLPHLFRVKFFGH